MVLVAALLALAAGLFLADPRPRRVSRAVEGGDVDALRRAAWTIIALGLAMKLVGLATKGATSVVDYYENLYEYNIRESPFGYFLDLGLPIAVFGFALRAATAPSVWRKGAYFLAAAGVSFALSSSRADLVAVIFIFGVVLLAYNGPWVRRQVRRPWLVAAGVAVLVLVVVGAGVKSQLRQDPSKDADLHLDPVTLMQWGTNQLGTRFSKDGVYDGYVNLVGRLHGDPSRLMGGRVLEYALLAPIPSLVYDDKPAHPFRDVGDLIRDNRNSRPDTVYAPTLVGSAFADFGTASALLYLFGVGLLLGGLRRAALASAHPLGRLAYLHLGAIECASAFIHSGIVQLTVGVALAAGTATVVYVVAFLAYRGLKRPNRHARPSHADDQRRRSLPERTGRDRTVPGLAPRPAAAAHRPPRGDHR